MRLMALRLSTQVAEFVSQNIIEYGIVSVKNYVDGIAIEHCPIVDK